MPNRVERLRQFADQLSKASSRERKYASVVRAAAGTLSENRLNEDLANEVDSFFMWLRSQGLLDEGQLVAEASALLRNDADRFTPTKAA
jgi:hypothetical protein